MTTMTAAVLYEPRDLRIAQVPRPEAGDDGVLIAVRAVGVCGTDLHTYKLGMFREMSVPVGDGALFGHEFAGELVAIGPNAKVEGVAVGDRVAGIGIGAYAEYCRCGPGMLGKPPVYRLPDAVSFEEAATIEPLTVSLSAVNRADPKPGDRVLIVGAGMIGLGCVQVLAALHPQCEVIVSDVSPLRLDMARTFGAATCINARQEDTVARIKALTGELPVIYNSTTSGQVDVVIECAGIEQTINQALEVVKPRGKVVLVALYEARPIVDMNQVVTKNLQLSGVLAYSDEDVRAAIDLIATGQVDRKPLITHRYALKDARQAFETQLNTSETLKAVVVND